MMMHLEEEVVKHFNLDLKCHKNNNPYKGQHKPTFNYVKTYASDLVRVSSEKLCVGHVLLKMIEQYADDGK